MDSIPLNHLGSSQCRSCHEEFYELWASSHHGLAMQPYTPEFAGKNLKAQTESIFIGKTSYRAVITEKPAYVLEKSPDGETRYPMIHVLGGKNIYYFLTALEKGHLQVLPVSFDINRKQWFDTAASSVRHFPNRPDEALHWKNRAYTFNTSCYGCHVSQLVRNYDIETDSYHTEWKEPGINCETCHGSAEDHVKTSLEAAAAGEEVKETKLKTVTQSRGFTAHQVNTACSVCHAKMVALTPEFEPGEDFFQHYDLVTLEHLDFYPDGRDLGENYTYTAWKMSPCVKADQLDCLYCHTSSGRYRFKGDKANDACVPCHEDKGQDLPLHSHHTPETGVTECVQCHMPKTEFGRMIRSDHSMRPPMPSATLKYKSPNACNLCHKDREAAWADQQVRQWHKDDYQEETLEIASWVDDARENRWGQLDDILTYLQSKDRDEIFANSLVRLLRDCPDEKKWPVMIKRLQNDPSPLIRSSAADGLQGYLNEQSLVPLLKATQDPYRLVRMRAAATLASVPVEQVPSTYRQSFVKSVDDYKACLMARPDDALAHYNLGNLYQSQGLHEKAIDSFKISWKLREDFTPAYVNASMAYNAQGKNGQAVQCLKNAIKYDSKSAAAHLNLALLYGEMGQYANAEKEFQKTFELDPHSAVAAYNLGVLLGPKNTDAAIGWIQKAYGLNPSNSKYAYTLAYYYAEQDRMQDVVEILQPLADSKIDDSRVYIMLVKAYIEMGQIQRAIEVCENAVEVFRRDEQTRSVFQSYIQQLTGR
jgi:tetratricopeptide (TPR) repeat protein